MRRYVGSMVLLASLLLASCTGGDTGTAPASDDATSSPGSASATAEGQQQGGSEDVSWPDGTWRLVSGSAADEPIEPVEGGPITLDLAAEEDQCWSDELPCWSGEDGCNQYVLPVERLDHDSIRTHELSVTGMACPGIDGYQEPAERYIDALLHIDSYSLTDGELRLTGPGIELEFEKE